MSVIQHILAQKIVAIVRLEDFMPGGGLVFNTIHNIQGNVPPENIMTMWETIQEYGRY
jgi:uroporphyrinogen decarboxylase